MKILGNKNNKDIYNKLLKSLIPKNIEVYVEPFGGQFGLYEILKNKPKVSIYNDININLYKEIYNKYDNVIYYNEDYKKIIKMYDNENTFFYLDPPYYKKEHLYENHDFFGDEKHFELFRILNNIKGYFLLSYKDCSFIRKIYSEYNIYKYKGKNMFHLSEIAITNY